LGAKLRAFLSAPVFPGDADKTIAASMVHYGIMFGVLANLLNVPAMALAGDPLLRILTSSTILIGALLLNLLFLKRGHVSGSGVFFLAAAWISLAAINFTAGGVKAPGFPIHIVFIICVGFIFGRSWAFFAAALSTSLGVLFVVLESRGLLPPPQVHNVSARYLSIAASNFFIVAAILTMMVNRLRRAIAEGRQELQVRQEAERALARHQETLEATVRERTAALAQANAALLQEVQERRQAEEDLRRERDFIGQLMETSPVGILVVDAGGRFTFANAAAALLLGRTREEITSLSCTAPEWRFTNHDGTPVAPADLPFQRTLSAGVRLRNVPLALVTPNERRVLLSVNTDPLGATGRTPGGCVITAEDVTERMRLEQEFYRAQKLESVGVLAGGIAHDFNNLLTGIMGNISLAQLGLPPEGTAAETLADAEKAALQARELTQQLLTFSRGGKPIKQTLAVGGLLANAAQFTVRGSNVRTELTVAPDLWTVEADQGQIGQVFHNLILNACQSMPGGGTVRLAAANLSVAEGDEAAVPAGNYVRVTVEDRGPGIPAENLMKIFDPFFSTKTGGTGLGLAVVYSVVKKHGGHVEVASTPGEGATFRVLLPASAKPAAGAAPQAEALAGRGRILLMDDEPVVRQVVSRILTTLGYEVRAVADGAAAVDLFREALAARQPFDAVILDLTVPGGMGGAEAIGRLRALDPDVRAIVSSGYSSDPVMSHFRDFGFASVIAKPFQAADLSRVLRQVLLDGREDQQTPSSRRK
jgi:PAS domain S-box-containing protein